MKLVAPILVWFLSFGTCWPQALRPDMLPETRSFTGQFLVRASAWPANAQLARDLTAAGNYVRLDPSMLVVSSERIKQLLWRKLEGKPSWRSPVYLEVRNAHSGGDLVELISERFLDGWRYRVELPDIIENGRFVRAIVQVLLLEIANRGSSQRSVEMPPWLLEGFARELLVSGDMAGELKIILPPPKTVVRKWAWNTDGINANELRTNSLYWARMVLGSEPPLTFEQLSWPETDSPAAGASEVYQSCAQLFVDRLLELPDGPACFRAMLAELPQHLNWQLAFFHAFQRHFQTSLDVEKWWAVEVAHFTGRELEQNWSSADSWRKLDDILRAQVDVRTAANALPLRTDVALQTLLRESNGIRDAQVYQQKLNALNALRSRVSPDLIGLVDAYRAAIGVFLERQKFKNPFLRIRKFHELALNRAAEDLIRKLDALEIQRQNLRPASLQPDVVDSRNVSAIVR